MVMNGGVVVLCRPLVFAFASRTDADTRKHIWAWRNSLCKEFHSLRTEYRKRLYSYASCARPG